MEMIQRFYKDTAGATMVEYALMLTFIALACFGSVGLLGSSLNASFGETLRGLGS
jgi:Flp pilus assembly pilin Flp